MVQSNHILSQTNEGKALVKSTGKIYGIKNKYAKYTVYVNINNDNLNDSLKDLMKSYSFDIDFESDILFNNDLIENNHYVKDNIFYQLDNGESYSQDDLIVGTDNIRESKLNNLLDNGI